MRAFVLLLFALLSGGEDLAALVAAAGKHVAAVAGLHALTETVNLFALPFLRLECTKHFFCTSFPNVLYHAAPCPVAKADWKYAFFLISNTGLLPPGAAGFAQMGIVQQLSSIIHRYTII